MKVVTWNLEQPTHRTREKNAKRVEILLQSEPDIAILTETHRAIDLGPDYAGFFTEPSPRKPREGEAVAAVWLRHSTFNAAAPVRTSDPREAVCVRAEFGSRKILVYGSILPYRDASGPDKNFSKPWDAHRAATRWHKEDWLRLRTDFPEHILITGGDYNQSRSGAGGYGSIETRENVTRALESAGLSCLTEQDFKTTHGLSRHCIDHICIDEGLAPTVSEVGVWEGTQRGMRLSDHNGVWVDLRLSEDPEV